MIVKLLTEHNLEFLSLKGGCRGSSESTLVKNVKLLEISCHGSFLLCLPDFESVRPSGCSPRCWRLNVSTSSNLLYLSLYRSEKDIEGLT